MSVPVADWLERTGIPYLIATGHDRAPLPDRFGAVPRLEKPSDVEQVTAAIPAQLR